MHDVTQNEQHATHGSYRYNDDTQHHPRGHDNTSFLTQKSENCPLNTFNLKNLPSAAVRTLRRESRAFRTREQRSVIQDFQNFICDQFNKVFARTFCVQFQLGARSCSREKTISVDATGGPLEIRVSEDVFIYNFERYCSRANQYEYANL